MILGAGGGATEGGGLARGPDTRAGASETTSRLGDLKVPKTRHINPSRAIGRTLKAWREESGMTLRGVAERADAYAEPVGFDYLSRPERGQLMPSVPKLSTL